MVFREEQFHFDLEVDREAAKLVREGTPPWKALGEATRIVTARRQYGARNENETNTV